MELRRETKSIGSNERYMATPNREMPKEEKEKDRMMICETKTFTDLEKVILSLLILKYIFKKIIFSRDGSGICNLPILSWLPKNPSCATKSCNA